MQIYGILTIKTRENLLPEFIHPVVDVGQYASLISFYREMPTKKINIVCRNRLIKIAGPS
jgi:hypothetical protein